MTSIKQVEQYIERQDVPRLVLALRDPNVLVRRRVVQALLEMKRPETVPALARLLHKEHDHYVVKEAVEALKGIADSPAVEALTWAAFQENRTLSALAGGALATMPVPEAVMAAEVRECLSRSDFERLAALGPEAAPALNRVIDSKQFLTWTSGKRKQVLTAAVQIGVRPPNRFRRELVEMGLFVSGVHTLGDLLFGLGHRSSLVRIAAADRLGTTGQGWTCFALHRRFRRELASGGDRKVAVAMARALAHLGDRRGIEHYKHLLYGSDVSAAGEASRALADIGTEESIQVLFWFVVQPPHPPAYHNVSQVLIALESAGPEAFGHLVSLAQDEDRRVRLMLAQVVGRTGHPDALGMLETLAHDSDPDVQHAALDAIAERNTPDAAEALNRLVTAVPLEWIVRSLAAVTHPAALGYLRALDLAATTLRGKLLEDDGKPLAGAAVQVVQEHHFGESMGWGWTPVSARAETDAAGAFALSILQTASASIPRLKVVTPPQPDGKGNQTFMAEIALDIGGDNFVNVRIDRFFTRLVLEAGRRWQVTP